MDGSVEIMKLDGMERVKELAANIASHDFADNICVLIGLWHIISKPIPPHGLG
jgi:hypothetical protein